MVIIPIGISGCGKTTYYKLLASKTKNVIRFSPQEYKENLRKLGKSGSEIKNKSKEFLEKMVKEGKHIYYDNYNITASSRAQILSFCSKYKQDVTFIYFCTSYRPDICESRVESQVLRNPDRINTAASLNGEPSIIRKQFDDFCNLAKNLDNLKDEMGDIKYDIKYIMCAQS